MGYIQVARLLDNFEVFSRVLSRALLINMGAAFASLGVLYLLTSTLFRPLEDITTVARQITRADDLSRRVDGIHLGLDLLPVGRGVALGA